MQLGELCHRHIEVLGNCTVDPLSRRPQLVPRGGELHHLAPFEQLLALVSQPFDEQPGADAYALPAPPGAGRFVTYCGT